MPTNATILLVEDSEMEQVLAKRAIEKACIDCILLVANDGAEACETLVDTRLAPPDLVLLDLHLPKVDGFEVLRRIRSHEPIQHTPVVVLSSTNDPAEILRCYELGANSFVRKTMDHEVYNSLLRLIVFYWTGINEPSDPVKGFGESGVLRAALGARPLF